MASLATLAKTSPARVLIVGYPGGGKTGALASLANAGYKLRILDFDGNYEPLINFTRPDALKNIDILTFEDKLRQGGRTLEVAGVPEAFTKAVKAMDRWKYIDENGQEVDLGSSKEWGCDTIVVLDSMTAMGIASLRRVENMLNKTALNRTQQVWGVAAAEQEAFIEKLTSKLNRHHTIVLAHMKMVGPKDVAPADSDLTKDLKERAADLVKTRYFPSALGWALPQTIAQHFPVVLGMEVEVRGTKVSRVLRTLPREDLDLKVPAPNLQPTYPIENGLYEIFQHIAPPLAGCVEAQGQAPAAPAAAK